MKGGAVAAARAANAGLAPIAGAAACRQRGLCWLRRLRRAPPHLLGPGRHQFVAPLLQGGHVEVCRAGPGAVAAKQGITNRQAARVGAYTQALLRPPGASGSFGGQPVMETSRDAIVWRRARPVTASPWLPVHCLMRAHTCWIRVLQGRWGTGVDGCCSG